MKSAKQSDRSEEEIAWPSLAGPLSGLVVAVVTPSPEFSPEDWMESGWIRGIVATVLNDVITAPKSSPRAEAKRATVRSKRSSIASWE